LSPAAVRAWKKLPLQVKGRLRTALDKLASEAAKTGRIGGKSVKTIQGAGDSFHRLRVGDYRVMYDVIDADRVILVLGIVDRGDLERWLRNR
jgi:mRNA interferase RelE/StbE